MSRKLRIASICRELPNPDDPSIGIFVLRRLEAMARLAQLEVIQPVAYFPGLKPWPAWAQSERRERGVAIRAEKMFYIPKVMKSLDGRWLAIAASRGLKRLAHSGGIDVVDAHFGYPEGVGGVRAARKLGIPVFITLRGFEIEYIAKPSIGAQMRRAFLAADGCICVSHTLKALVLEQGVAPEKVTVVHNAIDAETFHPGGQAESRRRLALREGSPLIVTVGHLISRKRHHVLIRAFADVLGRFPDARLAIIGGASFEPDYPPMLHRLVGELGIGESVRFVGNVADDEVAEWLRAADLFALGTQREGCCNAVLEALATGLPVVTTPVGDNAYFVRDGVNGFIVPVDDVGAMAAALRVALDRAAWDREAIAGSLGVGDWRRAAEQVLEFFESRSAA